MRYVLDTSFAIDYLRGMPAAVERLRALYEAGDDPLITDIVAAELWTGTGSSGEDALAAFLRYLEYVHPGPESAEQAGRWRAEARRRGRTLSLPDALIAATAHVLGAAVLTRNARDYSLTPVRVEGY